MRHRLTLIVFCAFALALSYESNSDTPLLQTIIGQQLEKSRPAGWGAPFIYARTSGNLHGEVESTVVPYGYYAGEGKDRNHWHYLVVFDPDDAGSYKASHWLLVGGGPQRFESLEIGNQIMTLTGTSYLPEDAMRCPSKDTSAEYFFSNNQLVARGN